MKDNAGEKGNFALKLTGFMVMRILFSPAFLIFSSAGSPLEIMFCAGSVTFNIRK
jgi:hypothetical protein